MEEQRQPLTIAQRQKKARQMKRLAPKLARFRKMRAKRMADREQLLKRAQKAARNVIRKKVAGERGTDYSALSASEKITIDKLVAKKSAIIQKLAKKLLPKVRKKEIERLKQARGSKTESFAEWSDTDFDILAEQCFLMIEKDEREKEVAQDSDVKDLPGTQPKKYYKGLSDKEKEARAKQFAKGADKPDDSPSSYKPAPGDDAETKPSKHTLKYKKMFGEKSELSKAQDAIKQEKQADKEKHDRMRDQARLRDTIAKNQQTEEVELSEDATKALQKKADKSGIPLGILRQVYNRGMAAWKTGHRPGATQQQWGFARVNSFITGGKTRTTADADLWAKAKGKKEEVEEAVGRGALKKGAMKNAKPQSDNTAAKRAQADAEKKRRKRVMGLYDELDEAVSPAQQAAIAISKKERGEKPKNLKAMLAVPSARPPSQMGEAKPTTAQVRMAKRLNKAGVGKNDDFYLSKMDPETRKKYEPKKRPAPMKVNVPKGKTFNWLRTEGADLEEMPRWLLEPLSKVTNKKGYEAAKKVLKQVLDRKKKEAGRKGLQHSIEYYAAQIAKQFQGVDARVLADMMSETPEKMDAPQIGTDEIRKRYADTTPGQISESVGMGHTMFAGEFLKIQGAYEHHPDVQAELDRRAMEEEGGAGEEGTDKLVKKYKKDTPISEAIEYHAENGLSIKENIFRPHSESYYAFFRECRRLWESGELEITDAFDKTLMESDAGLVGIYEGMEVPLDIPLIEEEDKELNKPKRGGAKKFYVYVKDGDKIKKISFGDTTGLSAKINDPDARKNFASRHNCDTANDKTTARYWSCRLPYYAKELGLKGGGSFFW
jgi:hypothetical protein